MQKKFLLTVDQLEFMLAEKVNLKFTDIQAVIGIEQMKKLDFRVNRSREMYNLYYENF